MSNSNNPYESPRASTEGKASEQKPATGLQRLDKVGILTTVVIVSILTLIDFAILGSYIFVLFAPPVLFFIITLWAFLGVSRGSTMEVPVRVSVGVLISLVTVPAFAALLFFTCMPAVEVVGASWQPHGGNPAPTRRAIGGFITFILVLSGSWLLYTMMTWRSEDKKKNPKMRR